MELAAFDYVILAAALCGAVVGLFIGFSGALAFLVGGIASAAAARFGWSFAVDLLPNPWLRGLVVSLTTLLVFGVVRWIVKKLVHGFVAQPGDAIFGAAVAGLTAFGLSTGGIWIVGLLAMGGDMPNSLILTFVVSFAR